MSIGEEKMWYVDPEAPVGAKGGVNVNLRRENVVRLIGGACQQRQVIV